MSGRANHPAFPTGHYPGLTIRDYFAGQAMPEMLRQANVKDQAVAKYARKVADAMLAELDGSSEATEQAEQLTFADAMTIAERCRHLDGGYRTAAAVHAFRDGVGAVVSELVMAGSGPARNKSQPAEQDVKQPKAGEFWRGKESGSIAYVVGYLATGSRVVVEDKFGIHDMAMSYFLEWFEYAPEVTSFDS